MLSRISSLLSREAPTCDLFYLIEGTQKPSDISVPYISGDGPMKVDTLRQIIFAHKCQDLAPTYENLTLIKARILLVFVPFALGLTLPMSLRLM
jgi:hypothetical protein